MKFLTMFQLVLPLYECADPAAAEPLHFVTGPLHSVVEPLHSVAYSAAACAAPTETS
jgi:hypothetical protein